MSTPRITETPRIDFVKHIQPILEQNCVGCHKADKTEGGLDLTSLATAFAEADSGVAIVPFDVDGSSLHGRLILDADDDSLMPPKSAGGPLTAEQIGLIRDWIAQGANWPDGLELTQRERVASTRQTPDTLELTRQLHAMIVETAERERAAGGGFDDYDSQVPRTGAKYSMIALEGGEFLMGSPADEADRRDDEGPQVPVTVSPFWIGKFEVTWDEYEPFMINGADRFKWGPTQSPVLFRSPPPASPPVLPPPSGNGTFRTIGLSSSDAGTIRQVGNFEPSGAPGEISIVPLPSVNR